MGYDDLVALPGLGPRSAPWLLAVGVESLADVERLGAVAVYRRVRDSRPGVNLNLLWGLEAVLRGCDWRHLTAADKAALRAEVAARDAQAAVGAASPTSSGARSPVSPARTARPPSTTT